MLGTQDMSAGASNGALAGDSAWYTTMTTGTGTTRCITVGAMGAVAVGANITVGAAGAGVGIVGVVGATGAVVDVGAGVGATITVGMGAGGIVGVVGATHAVVDDASVGIGVEVGAGVGAGVGASVGAVAELEWVLASALAMARSLGVVGV